MIHQSFRSIFHFYVFVVFYSFPYWYLVLCHCRRYVAWFIFNLLKADLSILENAPCAEENIFSVAFGCNVCKYVWFICKMKWFSAYEPLLIMCLNNLSIDDSGRHRPWHNKETSVSHALFIWYSFAHSYNHHKVYLLQKTTCFNISNISE